MAERTFTITQQQYEALIALARAGTVNDDGVSNVNESLKLDAFLKKIESDNGVTRSALWVQWQEMDQPLPPSTNFPDVWPPELRFYIEFVTRLVSKADVEAMLEVQARNPNNVLVTRDPAARVGWTAIDDFFVTG
jgi:hypothetical protein